SLGTPNGQKVTIMLEELLALGKKGAEYDAWLIRIGEGQQFGSGFVAINPNSKIPAMVDRSGKKPIRIFESGAILLYLAEKFGPFYAYAPIKIEYAINRYAMETKRQLDVLDRRLKESEYVAGKSYTIADMAIWPWYGGLVRANSYGAAEFLSVQDYRHVLRWADLIAARPAVKRGRIVNRTSGDPSSQLHERHDASDFDLRTQDRLKPETAPEAPAA